MVVEDSLGLSAASDTITLSNVGGESVQVAIRAFNNSMDSIACSWSITGSARPDLYTYQLQVSTDSASWITKYQGTAYQAIADSLDAGTNYVMRVLAISPGNAVTNSDTLNTYTTDNSCGDGICQQDSESCASCFLDCYYLCGKFN